jgi:hypothetical protein
MSDGATMEKEYIESAHNLHSRVDSPPAQKYLFFNQQGPGTERRFNLCISISIVRLSCSFSLRAAFQPLRPM